MVRGCIRVAVVLLLGAASACGAGTTHTATPTPNEPSPTPSVYRFLRPDGIDTARFGRPVEEVLPDLIAMLGQPDRDETLHNSSLLGYGADPGKEGTLRSVTWTSLTLVFLDRSGQLDMTDVPLIAWMSHGVDVEDHLTVFATAEGIGIGSTRSELEAAYGARVSVFDEEDPCTGLWQFIIELPLVNYVGSFERRPSDPAVQIQTLRAGPESSC